MAPMGPLFFCFCFWLENIHPHTYIPNCAHQITEQGGWEGEKGVKWKMFSSFHLLWENGFGYKLQISATERETVLFGYRHIPPSCVPQTLGWLKWLNSPTQSGKCDEINIHYEIGTENCERLPNLSPKQNNKTKKNRCGQTKLKSTQNNGKQFFNVNV